MLRVHESDTYDGSGGQVGKQTLNYTPTQLSNLQYQTAGAYSDTETLYDGYGRQSRIAIYKGQSSNGWYQTDICYNSAGEVSFQSYSYQSTGFVAPKICSGSGGDTYTYDALARPLNVTHGDGTTSGFSYSGRATQISESGSSRITQVDGLGRLTAVCEISSSTLQGDSPGLCGLDLSGTGFSTSYSYNLANRSTTITQGVQTRTFQTDSLGRIILTQEPERGQTNYGYTYSSTAGLGLTVTRRRPTANQASPSVFTNTTTQYDVLGRIVSKNYSDGEGPVLYGYDISSVTFDPVPANSSLALAATLQHPKGRMAWTCREPAAQNSCITQDALSYDALGRVIQKWSSAPSYVSSQSPVRTQTYSYDWEGNVLSVTDTGGVTTSYNYYTPANEVQSITSSLNDANHPGTLVSAIQHGPNGPLSYELGNGLSQSFSYDTLGRNNGRWLCSGTAQNGCTGGTQLYGFTLSWTTTANRLHPTPYIVGRPRRPLGPGPGGNVTQLCDTSLGRCENFGYDEFDRLTSQTTTSGTAVNMNWVYDRYGNRWQQNALNGGNNFSASFNVSANQLNSSGYRYDAAGNLLSDGINTYSYDAEGNLVQELNGATVNFIYDALNRQVGFFYNNLEYDNFFNVAGQFESVWQVSNQSQIIGKVYWNSLQQELESYAPGSSGGTYFQHFDAIGTKRMTTNSAGAVFGSYITLPFGDGFTDATGHDDNTYDGFAGLWSGPGGLTDHAQYREYANTSGRWMQPDPYDGSYDFTNPQSLNRYSYVLNNPLSFTDPTGLILCDYGSSDNGSEEYEDAASRAECTENGGSIVTDQQSVTVSGTDTSFNLSGISTGEQIPFNQTTQPTTAAPDNGQTNRLYCGGTTYALAGNPNNIGQQGFPGVTVTNGSAAVIPRQWTGQFAGGPLMRSIGASASGTIFGPNGQVEEFNGITQAIGNAALGTAQQAQDIIMARAPNALILEVVGGQDLGKNASVLLDLPNRGQGCPAGTTPAKVF
jgi:RHS repeat-associated protein